MAAVGIVDNGGHRSDETARFRGPGRRTDCPGARAGLELAGHRAGAHLLFVRPRSPIRARAAPRDRHRSCDRHTGARARCRVGLLRRDGPRERQDGDDPDAGRVFGHAGAAWLLLGAARPGRLRRRGGRHRRLGRRRWTLGALRPPRRPADPGPAGLPRPPPPSARSAGCAAARGGASAASRPGSARASRPYGCRAPACSDRRGRGSARPVARPCGGEEAGFSQASGAGFCGERREPAAPATARHPRREPTAGDRARRRSRGAGCAGTVSRPRDVPPDPAGRASVQAHRDSACWCALTSAFSARRGRRGRPLEARACRAFSGADPVRFARPPRHRARDDPLRAPARLYPASVRAAPNGRSEGGSYH